MSFLHLGQRPVFPACVSGTFILLPHKQLKRINSSGLLCGWGAAISCSVLLVSEVTAEI